MWPLLTQFPTPTTPSSSMLSVVQLEDMASQGEHGLSIVLDDGMLVIGWNDLANLLLPALEHLAGPQPRTAHHAHHHSAPAGFARTSCTSRLHPRPGVRADSGAQYLATTTTATTTTLRWIKTTLARLVAAARRPAASALSAQGLSHLPPPPHRPKTELTGPSVAVHVAHPPLGRFARRGAQTGRRGARPTRASIARTRAASPLPNAARASLTSLTPSAHNNNNLLRLSRRLHLHVRQPIVRHLITSKPRHHPRPRAQGSQRSVSRAGVATHARRTCTPSARLRGSRSSSTTTRARCTGLARLLARPAPPAGTSRLSLRSMSASSRPASRVRSRP